MPHSRIELDNRNISIQYANSLFAKNDLQLALQYYVLLKYIYNELEDILNANIRLCVKRILSNGFSFKRTNSPDVSIIITSFDNFDLTMACLCSIHKNIVDVDYEIIVVDDCSSFELTKTLDLIEGITLLKNSANIGYLRSCNSAASHARGEYLALLNNDTMVTTGWLKSLIEVANNFSKVGIVGSQLRHPNGVLQEIGGIVWSDGSAARYLDGSVSLNNSDSRRVRNVDYCSAASILIKSHLWAELGGFDDSYAPAYYEDTDLCFRARQIGYRTVVQPLSIVVHLQGASYGKSALSQANQLQEINKKKFYERWGQLLVKENMEPGCNILMAKERIKSKNIVILVDRYIPEIEFDAGSKSTSCIIECLIDAGMHVIFYPMAKSDHYCDVFKFNMEQKGAYVLQCGANDELDSIISSCF